MCLSTHNPILIARATLIYITSLAQWMTVIESSTADLLYDDEETEEVYIRFPPHFYKV